MYELDPEVEKFLESSLVLRQLLGQVLPKNAVDHLVTLVVKDNARRKMLKLMEEVEAQD